MPRQEKKEQRTAHNEREQQHEKPKRSQIRRETKYGIISVILILFAIVSVFSFLQLAGSVGVWFDRLLALLFGWGKYVFPLVFAVLAWMFWKTEELKVKASNWFGFALFVLAYSGILHLFIVMPNVLTALNEGKGGGYIGVALSYPLRQIMGPWATGVILVGVAVIGLLLWFDTSLPELADRGNILTRLIFRFRRFKERLRRNWTMRSIDTPEQKNLPDEPEVESEAEDDTLMSDEAREAIAKAEEKLKQQARNEIERKQKPLLKRHFGGKPYPIDLLFSSHDQPTSGDIKANQEIIKRTLETFGIAIEMAEVNVGPTVTQYTFRPAEGVKLSQITTLANDLALALAAHPIRIEAPIPGRSLVGIEVPNQAKAIVKLRDVLDSSAFKKRDSTLAFALGKDVAGNPLIASLERMPHMLIAGATGSGKSVCINSILLSLLYTNTPDTLRLILVDPKRVELTVYNDIPHLLTPVITTVEKTIAALRWVTGEMDRRFKLFEQVGKRNIDSYNDNGDEKLPFIVVIIDELADLMAVAANEVEGVIIRLAQMARAVGIHLVVATQRPSVDVITGLIKANITSRIAFSVASSVDSRTILDTVGAEKLLGRGDMLFTSAELSKPKRIQGTFVTDEEIEAVATFLKGQAKPEYEESVVAKQQTESYDAAAFGDEGSDDELYEEAKDLVLAAGKASASYLQRRMRIGYARAARLLDLLEERGIIGPGDGAKPREVYGQAINPKMVNHEMLDPIGTDESEDDPREEESRDS